VDTFSLKGGELEKPINGLNGQLKHQYTNSVEMEDKEIISTKEKLENGNGKCAKDEKQNGVTNESSMT
jgi:hypothetical protein